MKNEHGKWPIIDLNDYPSGAVNVDVKIVEIDGGIVTGEYEGIFFAGHVAYELLDDDVTLKPRIGWGLALKEKANRT